METKPQNKNEGIPHIAWDIINVRTSVIELFV